MSTRDALTFVSALIAELRHQGFEIPSEVEIIRRKLNGRVNGEKTAA